MFQPIDGTPTTLATITVDGQRCDVRHGVPLALALLEAGVAATRLTPVSGAPRAPLCLMGVCFECVVHLDGVANVQSCMVVTQDGMQVRLPKGARDLECEE